MNTTMILASVLLNCVAQLCMRQGMLQVGEISIASLWNNFGSMITNLWLWGSMCCYAVSILLWMAVLSRVEVSYAYPFLSIGYVVAAIAGYCFFNENISVIRIVGIVVICIGVILISRS